METTDCRWKNERMHMLANDTIRQNKSYTADFYYAIQISVYLLKPIGAWPLTDGETSRRKIALHKVSMTIATSLLIFLVVPWIVYIIKANWGIILILRGFCPLLFTLTIFARYVLLLWHQDQLKSCVDRIADDWRHTILAEDREIMLTNARLGRTFGIVSVAFMFTSGILYHLLPLVLPKEVNEDNVTVRFHPSPCELLVFDAKASPVYEIVYCMQLLSGCTAYSAFCGICSLMAHFVTHICGQCDVLASVFEEAVDGGERNHGPIDSRIAIAVNRHLRLLNNTSTSRFYQDLRQPLKSSWMFLLFSRLSSDVSDIFTEICLMEFINASCNICLIGYYIITDLNNNESFVQICMYLFALASIIFNVFIYCFIGDLLTESCQKVGSACYEIQWYRMSPRKAIEMIIPITMSRYPISLSAGKMTTMTLTTFSDILKTSMAYFNLLREFSSRDAVKT